MIVALNDDSYARVIMVRVVGSIVRRDEPGTAENTHSTLQRLVEDARDEVEV